MIQEKLTEVRDNIIQSCARAGRSPEEVTLIAVSKTKPVSAIEVAIAAGQTVFGENKVQELCDKREYFQNPALQWHMIGHLQRNKVKYLIGKTALIHSVDSLRLAEQIDAGSAKAGAETDILIEVNMAREGTKFGVMPEDAERLIRVVAALPHVHICGLMTIAPYVAEAEDNRSIFRQMYQLYIDIKDKKIDNVDMKILSMGMTRDYQVAIEEGATMVRVGTGIFGERNYNR